MKPMHKTLRVTVRTVTDAAVAYAYLRDFSNATHWDSGTESCERTFGDGGPGTVYHNKSRFGGLPVELDYVVELDQAPVFQVVGRNATTVGRDTITVTPDPAGGALIDYRAEFELDVLWPLRPVISVLFDRLGAATALQLRGALDRLSR